MKHACILSVDVHANHYCVHTKCCCWKCMCKFFPVFVPFWFFFLPIFLVVIFLLFQCSAGAIPVVVYGAPECTLSHLCICIRYRWKNYIITSDIVHVNAGEYHVLRDSAHCFMKILKWDFSADNEYDKICFLLLKCMNK